jgi:hypothetical protein
MQSSVNEKLELDKLWSSLRLDALSEGGENQWMKGFQDCCEPVDGFRGVYERRISCTWEILKQRWMLDTTAVTNGIDGYGLPG